ncbi:glycosyltransferase [Deltaproteobacteria bacterium TL4]
MNFVFINTGNKNQNAGIVRCLGLGESLVRMGHQVTILISDQKENVDTYQQQYNGVQFIYTASGSIKEQLDKTYKLVCLKNIDVVHCMGAGSSIFIPALITKILFRRRFLLVVDYEDKQSLMLPGNRQLIYRLYEWLSFRYADKIVCASRQLANEYQKRFSRQVFYLPFAASQQYLISTKIKQEFLNLCYLGNLIEAYAEQFNFLINAIPYLHQSGIRFQLHIIGGGNFLEELKLKAKEKEIEKEVAFHGFVPDRELEHLMRKMDIFLLPVSDTPMNKYRCPHKAFLYCSTGLPIVTNQVGEVAQLLGNYPNTIYFEENDYRSFVQAILNASQLHHEVPDSFYHSISWNHRTTEYLTMLNLA